MATWPRTGPRTGPRAEPRTEGPTTGRRWLAATLLAGLMLVAPPPAAGPAAAADEKSADELAAEAVDKLLRALDLLIGSIPQYEAPYVNEDGDIIIRRKRDKEEGPLPTPEEKPAPPGAPDTTTT